MRPYRTLYAPALGLLLAVSVYGQEQAEANAWATDAAKEGFLRRAEPVEWKSLSTGITKPLKVTATLDGRRHTIHVQTVETHEPALQTSCGLEREFEDSYRYNIAAYRLDRLLGIGMVPVSVKRSREGVTGCVTWWLDDLLMSDMERIEKNLEPPDRQAWEQQRSIRAVFDQLIHNSDRHAHNLLIDRDWKVWMIDHSRSFALRDELCFTAMLKRCDQKLLQRLRGLDEKTLTDELGDLVSKDRIRALLTRRDRILAIYDQAIGERGEEAVLFDYLD